MNNKNIKTLLQIVVVVMPILVYLPALTFDFVNWDDGLYVFDNPALEKSWYEYIVWAFQSNVAGIFHPLTLISLKIDYTVWGYAPLGYHLTNIIFHVLNSLILFNLLFNGATLYFVKKSSDKIFEKALFFSALAALIFAVHPLHIESVAWVSERKDVLFLFFYLLSINYYIEFLKTDSKEKKFLHYCFILFLCSLLSKPMAVSLPVIILILDYLYGKIGQKTLIKDTIVSMKNIVHFIFASFIFSVISIGTQSHSKAVADLEIYSLATRILISIDSYWFYIVKTFVPVNLAPVYICSKNITLSSTQYQIAGAAFILLLGGTWVYRNNKIITAMVASYLITLLPVAGLVKVGSQCYADRYSYLPGIFITILIVSLVMKFYEKKIVFKTLVAVTVSAIILLINVSTKQIYVWEDGLALWSRQIELSGDKHPIAYKNMAVIFGFRKQFKEAEILLHYGIKISKSEKELRDFYNELGLLHIKQNNHEEAIKYLKKSLGVDPEYGIAAYNLYKVYKNAGDRDASLFYYKIAESLGTDRIKEEPDMEFEKLLAENNE